MPKSDHRTRKNPTMREAWIKRKRIGRLKQIWVGAWMKITKEQNNVRLASQQSEVNFEISEREKSTG